MNYLATEAEIEVKGKHYKFARFDYDVLNKFLFWADKKLGHPLDQVREQIKDFPPNLQEIIVRDALAKANVKRTFDSLEVQGLLLSPEGIYQLMFILLQRYQPNLTYDEVVQLQKDCIAEHGLGYLENKLKEAQGKIPTDPQEKKEEFLVEKVLLEPEKKVAAEKPIPIG